MSASHATGRDPMHGSSRNDDVWLDELRELIHRRPGDAIGQPQAEDSGARWTRRQASVLEREATPRHAGTAVRTTSSKPAPRRKPAPLPRLKPYSPEPDETPSSAVPPETSLPPNSFPFRGSAKVRHREADSAIEPHDRSQRGGRARGIATVPLTRPSATRSESAAPPPQIRPNVATPRAQPPDTALRLAGARHRRDRPVTRTPLPVMATSRKEPLARRAVRASGELLITLGLVVMLFAGYEVYGKTWQVNAEQGRLTEALDQKWDAAGTQTPVTDEPIPGEGIARLHIPILGKKWVVVQGVALKDIKNAPGHYPDSQMPDELGNFAVAGHRTPAIFWDLDKLSDGDSIILETSTDWYVYRIYSSRIVLPTETDVVDANPDNPGTAPTRKVLTLTTCNPKWDNYERLIIAGEQIRNQPKTQGRPNELGA